MSADVTEKTKTEKKTSAKSEKYAAIKYPYAVIKAGGKQYRVAVGDMILVEKIEVEAGASWTTQEVLMVAKGPGAFTIGQPTVAGATVACDVLQQTLEKKVNIMHNRRRHNSQKSMGHRQPKTRLVIKSIA